MLEIQFHGPKYSLSNNTSHRTSVHQPCYHTVDTSIGTPELLSKVRPDRHQVVAISGGVAEPSYHPSQFSLVGVAEPSYHPSH